MRPRQRPRRPPPPFLVRIVTIPTNPPKDTASSPSPAPTDYSSNRRTAEMRFGRKSTGTRLSAGAGPAEPRPSRPFTYGSTSLRLWNTGCAIIACSSRSRTKPTCIPPSLPGAGTATWSKTGRGSRASSVSWSHKSRGVRTITCLSRCRGTHVPILSTGRLSMRASRSARQTVPRRGFVSSEPVTRHRPHPSLSRCGRCYGRCFRDMASAGPSCCLSARVRRRFQNMSASTSKPG